MHLLDTSALLQLVILDIPTSETEQLNTKRSKTELIPALQFEKVLQGHETAHEYRHKLSQGFSQAAVPENNELISYT